MEIEIRAAEEADIQEIAELERICFSTPWSEAAIAYEIQKNRMAMYFVAVDEESGEVIGYAGLWKILDEGHITNVAVSPQYRQCGIGRRLLARLLKAAEAAGAVRQTLEVRRSNRAALCLYHGYGFHEAGIRKGYYEDDGEDAVIMWRE